MFFLLHCTYYIQTHIFCLPLADYILNLDKIMRSPKEIVEYTKEITFIKENTPIKKVCVLGFIAGAYIAIGALLSVVVGHGAPAITDGNPSIMKLLMGVTFPIGLIMIVLAGGELFTGCCALFAPNLLNGEHSIRKIVKYCSILWVMNFIGALFFGYFIIYLPEISHSELTRNGFFAIAEAKTSSSFLATMLKGVGANWLVCVAVWLGMASKSASGKILGTWFPIMTFVTIGYEHSIANMLFLPVAMMEGYDLSICELFTKNLIPVTIGNIIGGFIFVGGIYWYLFGKLGKQN